MSTTMPRQRPRSRKDGPETESLQSDAAIELQEDQNSVQMSRERKDSYSAAEPCNLEGDYLNLCLLVFLYVLQGIPLGLAGSIPLILQQRKASYAQQAVFSFVTWPFSIKLLWAPIVDSVFSSRFGRRKSWLVPVQYLLGFFMMLLSYHINEILGDELPVNATIAANQSLNVNETSSQSDIPLPDGVWTGPNIYLLTLIFGAFNFLAATQDIAVDGWALTMLQRRNVGYASTCNTVGQTAGFFLGNVVFLALESADFCNRVLWFLRDDPTSTIGLVTLSGFLWFWGLVFLVTTTIVMLTKSESQHIPGHYSEDEPDHGILGTYFMLYKILKLPAIQLFVLVLFTCKVGFAAADSVTGLKLLEAGVKKEHLAMLAVPLVPLQIILPMILSKYTAGPRPLNIFLKAFPARLVIGLSFTLVLYWTKYIKNPEDGSFPWFYYAGIVSVYAVHQITVFSVFVSLMGFHAKVSDPSIGGTYMTLLNTLTNLGGNWPATTALWAVEKLDVKSCTVVKETDLETCTVVFDGYYTESILCFILGCIWFTWGKSKILRLQKLPPSSWLVK